MKAQDILDFWFEELEPKQWWVKDLALDHAIKQRFEDTHLAALAGELFHWRKTPEGRLAEVIVLDQFSRNMYRDTPASFASDPLSLCLAQTAVAVGDDLKLTDQQRSFLYMPYMHSESLLIHDEAMRLFKGLSNLDFEIKHRDIIVKFGRYPHRNDILGRESTAEEKAFLTQPDSSF
ncbi:DUF924 family protein [Marinicella rhabdoformis]|uniref:DUF924 family protein n=1 Tax=Marinicella rhabdoformis TaxID=2580566 RepID=UPI0012AECEBE|nr:DUF924 family protein [Marinicella rhabdoformis]